MVVLAAVAIDAFLRRRERGREPDAARAPELPGEPETADAGLVAVAEDRPDLAPSPSD